MTVFLIVLAGFGPQFIGALLAVCGFIQVLAKFVNNPSSSYTLISVVFVCLGVYWQFSGSRVFSVVVCMLLMAIFILSKVFFETFSIEIKTSFLKAVGFSVLLVPAIVTIDSYLIVAPFSTGCYTGIVLLPILAICYCLRVPDLQTKIDLSSKDRNQFDSLRL